MPSLGTGTTITFGTSGFSANLLSIDGPELQRESIDVSTMATTTNRAFLPGTLLDGGEVDMTFEFDGDDTPLTALASEGETITITWGSTGDTWTFTGFMTSYKPGAQLEQRMEATAKVKVTGAVTIKPAA